MATPSSFTFNEALQQFVAHRKGAKKATEGHQEINRFILWIGRDRKLEELSPSEVSDYAQHISLGGSESAHRIGPVKAFLTFLKEQGMIETGLAAHLRVPRTRRTAVRKAGDGASVLSTPKRYVSQDGYDKMLSERDDLKREQVAVVEEIRVAMADKDFRENAPLDAAKEKQGIIEARIRELNASISESHILSDTSNQQHFRVTVGNNVTLKDMDSGKKVLYTLVDMREADVAAGKISTASPVGQALMDKAVGEEVSINVPRGTLRYLIEKVGS